VCVYIEGGVCVYIYTHSRREKVRGGDIVASSFWLQIYNK